jgi:hypothetical protein
MDHAMMGVNEAHRRSVPDTAKMALRRAKDELLGAWFLGDARKR